MFSPFFASFILNSTIHIHLPAHEPALTLQATGASEQAHPNALLDFDFDFDLDCDCDLHGEYDFFSDVSNSFTC